MFTGIIEEIGEIATIVSIGGGIRLKIIAPLSVKELKVNDSISINGACQTIIRKDTRSFEVEAVEETLKKTTFGALQPKDKVNLELPLKFSERLGGHLVLGHVDTTGAIKSIDRLESSILYTISIGQEFTKYIIRVGSICIDGVSLTIAGADGDHVRVSIIPHTLEQTIFKWYKVGSNVNIEFDLLGKYIDRLLADRSSLENKTFLSEEGLKDMGY